MYNEIYVIQTTKKLEKLLEMWVSFGRFRA